MPPVEVIPEPLLDPEAARRGRGQSAAVGDATGSPVPAPAGSVVSLALLVPAALLALPELVRRWRRRHPSADVARQVAVLWERALGAIQATGFRARPDADSRSSRPERRHHDSRWRHGR